MVKSKVTTYFKQHYTNSFLLIKSPGRVNLIGEHTDYNLGYVLPASIEKGIYFALSENNSDSIHIEAFLTSPEKITFDLNGNTSNFEAFWGNYFKAILEILVAEKYPLRGFDCVFGGDIPIGSGLSSSAALCCGFIYAVSKALIKDISREKIALIAQKAEHKIGLNCGLMDQYAVLFGKKSNALFLDCKNLNHQYAPINLDGYSWVLINSNIKHNLAVDSEYNKRRISCETIVEKVATLKSNVDSLRDVTLKDLEGVKEELNPTDYQRAHYVLQENNRVLQMMEALQNGNAEEVGEILLQGHWAMSKEFEITTKELDYLVKIGMELEGVLGSRMMGGGFGGCTINLMENSAVNQSIERLLTDYKSETGISAEVYRLQIDDGVHVIEF